MSSHANESGAVDWRIAVGGDATRAVYERPLGTEEHSVFVCAHGAGGHMSDRAMLAATNALRAKGFGVVRFNFLYKEKGSGRPDPMPTLMTTVAAVVDRARTELGAGKKLIIGGRSMGGRAASMLAADGVAADGLLLLAYPLHPAGKPGQLRDAHLPRITMPVLCFNGTRDALCTRELMERVLMGVPTSWAMHWLDGADHSLHVLKSSGRDDAAVVAEVAEASARWVANVGG